MTEVETHILWTQHRCSAWDPGLSVKEEACPAFVAAFPKCRCNVTGCLRLPLPGRLRLPLPGLPCHDDGILDYMLWTGILSKAMGKVADTHQTSFLVPSNGVRGSLTCVSHRAE